MKKIKLGIIFGGRSGEHEVSLKSAKQVIDALCKECYIIYPIAITKKGDWLLEGEGLKYLDINLAKAQKEGGVEIDRDFLSEKNENVFELLKKTDLILPILHGPYGEDGRLQGMLDMLSVPYVFSGTLASALAMNKQKTKIIAKKCGLKVAKEIIIEKNKKYKLDKIIEKIIFPIVIKPIESGSSVGIDIVKNKQDLEKGIEKAFFYGEKVMLEEYIKGRELTVGVMGEKKPKALPVIEVVPKLSVFFDYKAKYQVGGSQEICPANIPEEIRKKVQKNAIKIFKALDCRDLARADFIWENKSNSIYFLEINTIPGMTSTSLAPQAAKAEGMNFSQFLDKLIASALKRKK
jgi:D-alanine-D-alanine ligase